MRAHLAVLLMAVAACGDSATPAAGPPQSDRSTTQPGPGESENGSGFGGTDGGPSSGDPRCGGRGSYIYMLESAYDPSYKNGTKKMRLRRFEPETSQVTDIGPVDCHIQDRPFQPYGSAMAVERSGIAVMTMGFGEYKKNNLKAAQAYRIDTKDGSCTATGISVAPPLANPANPNDCVQWVQRGWAYTSKDAGSEEVLFGLRGHLNPQRVEFFTFDSSTLQGSSVGFLEGIDEASLMGDGDGRVLAHAWGSNDDKARLIQIAPSTAAIAALDDLKDVPSAGERALWGGDLWLFDVQTIRRYKLATDKSVTTVWSAPGAEGEYQGIQLGVSTCAPSTPIK